MKRDLLTSVLALILLASAMAAAAMCYKLLRLSQEFRINQEKVVRVNQQKAAMNQFLVDLNEYGLRNPALNPLLDQMKFRLRAVTNTIPVQVQ
jgi:6-phosphogluconate dehydrogenase (decarboxylating)